MFGKKREVEQLLNDVRNWYLALNDFVLDSYELKPCPDCSGRTVTMQNVSETGQTVEYACNNCERNITVKLLPDKDGMRAVEKINQIKSIFRKIMQLSGDKYFNRNLHIEFRIP